VPIPKSRLKPMWETTDGETVRLYQGDVLPVLNSLPERSVQCVVTSPPYWGLRDYGTGTWEGGDAACDHLKGVVPRTGDQPGRRFSTLGHNPERPDTTTAQSDHQFKDTCGKCGAKRTDHQLGNEALPDCGQLLEVEPGLFQRSNCAERDWASACHVCRMVLVFRGVRRVLRDDGVVWLNYGDSYNANTGAGFNGDAKRPAEARETVGRGGLTAAGLKPGNLVGVPWRVALALQADGWVLRQDVIWHKPSPMPESVRNRCTKAHEYVFLLAKRRDYFYDAEAIKETVKGELRSTSWEERKAAGASGGDLEQGVSRNHGNGLSHDLGGAGGKSNKRSVWTVSSQGYPGAHFATFPPRLIEPMIKAGTSEYGCCAACRTPWRRVTSEEKLRRERPNEYVKYADTSHEKKNRGVNGQKPQGGWDALRVKDKAARRADVNACANTVAGVAVTTVGWEPGCECGEGVVPCVVLDPFMGSGTVADVCVDLGRRAWGVELNEGYVRKNQIPRVEGALMRRGSTAGLIPGRGAKAVKLTGRLV